MRENEEKRSFYFRRAYVSKHLLSVLISTIRVWQRSSTTCFHPVLRVLLTMWSTNPDFSADWPGSERNVLFWLRLVSPTPPLGKYTDFCSYNLGISLTPSSTNSYRLTSGSVFFGRPFAFEWYAIRSGLFPKNTHNLLLCLQSLSRQPLIVVGANPNLPHP